MHLVETMAYAGEQPWHGLGNKLAPGQSIEQWKQSAGMDWRIEETEVRYATGSHGVDSLSAYPEQKVLYRSDTQAPLAVVSKRFNVVQPGGSTPIPRTLQLSPIMGQEECHATAEEVQRRVQA